MDFTRMTIVASRIAIRLHKVNVHIDGDDTQLLRLLEACTTEHSKVGRVGHAVRTVDGNKPSARWHSAARRLYHRTPWMHRSVITGRV